MQVKYKHPEHHDLTWSGRGKKPAWVATWLDAGGALKELDVTGPAHPAAVIDAEPAEHIVDGAEPHPPEAGAALAVPGQDAMVRAVAQRLGYQLPADCTDPDLIQRDIAANMRRSVEACLEVGRGLAVLKEMCQHGQFLARLEVLNLDHSVAKRFMQAARKFSKGASTHLLAAAGNQTKLFEMLVLDDEQIEELELTGQTGELKLDDVATMSVKELRAALREAKAAAQQEKERLAAKDRHLASDAQRIRDLQDQLAAARTVEFTPSPRSVARTAAEQAALDEIDQAERSVLLALPRLFRAVSTVLDDGDVSEAVHWHARRSVEFLVQQLAGLAEEYDIRVDLEERLNPSWLLSDGEMEAMLEARKRGGQSNPAQEAEA